MYDFFLIVFVLVMREVIVENVVALESRDSALCPFYGRMFLPLVSGPLSMQYTIPHLASFFSLSPSPFVIHRFSSI